MESRSAPAHRGCVPWQGLLLTASLLTFWSLPTTAQLTIESVPPNAAEGKDVLLHVHNLPGFLGGYVWFKGESVDSNHQIASYIIDTQEIHPGPAYSSRETIYPNGSLLFQNVTLQDTGYYTLLAIKKIFQGEIVTGQLRVYQPVGKPSIRASNATVTEHKDAVVLTCLTNDRGISIRWLFKNQSLLLTARMKLSRDNSVLTIDPVRREDAGGYQCEVFNPVSSSKTSILTLWSLPTTAQLTIESVPPNAAEGKDVLLRVHNLPGNLMVCIWYKGEKIDNNLRIASYTAHTQAVTLGPAYSQRETMYPNGSLLFQKVTLQDTGYYTLVALDKDAESIQVTGQLRVYQPVGKPALQASNATVTEHKDTLVLTCLTNDRGISIRWLFKNQILPHKHRMKLSQDNSILTIDPVRREDTGSFQCEVFNPISSSKSDPLKLDVQYDPTLPSPGLSVGAMAGIVVGVLAGVALVAALAYFLYVRKTGGSMKLHILC